MGRFSDIRRGTQLKTALDNYITYLQTPKEPNLNSQGPKPTQIRAYLTPFGIDIATDELVPVSASQDGYNRLATLINNANGAQAEIANTVGTKTPTDINGFSPARLVTFENATRSVTVATSDVTKQKYLKYAGDRFQCPFGRKAATDDLYDAFNILYAAAKARTGLAINRVSLINERISNR